MVHVGELGNLEPIRELVYRHLRDRILSGSYVYGERLIESEIAAALGVSRTPVREAMRMLELEGLVRYLNRRGVMVTNIAGDDMDEIYALREVLEGLSARLCAELRTEEQGKQLMDLHAQMEHALMTGNADAFTNSHTQFNMCLYHTSGNQRLTDILSRFNEYIAKSQLISLTRHGRGNEIIEEHRAIVEAIVKRDADRAESLTRQHVANARRAFFDSRQVANGVTEAAKA